MFKRSTTSEIVTDSSTAPCQFYTDVLRVQAPRAESGSTLDPGVSRISPISIRSHPDRADRVTAARGAGAPRRSTWLSHDGLEVSDMQGAIDIMKTKKRADHVGAARARGEYAEGGDPRSRRAQHRAEALGFGRK